MRSWRWIGMAFLAWLVLPIEAQANITISESVIYIKKTDKPISEMTVTSVDKEKVIAVKTIVEKVVNSGLPNEQRIPTKEFMVAPSAFNLNPTEARRVRLVLKRPQDEKNEAVYRVTFKPDTPDHTVEKNDGTGVVTKVSVLIGMGALILVEPPQAKYDLVVNRNGKQIDFINAGNVSAEMHSTKICKDSKNCIDFSGKRLYAGAKWSFPLPAGYEHAPFSLTVRSSGDYKVLQVP